MKRHANRLPSTLILGIQLFAGGFLALMFAILAFVLVRGASGETLYGLTAAPIAAVLPIALVFANILRFWKPRQEAEKRVRQLSERGYLASGVIRAARSRLFDRSRRRVEVDVDWPVAARVEVDAYFYIFDIPPPPGTRVELLIDPSDWTAGYLGPHALTPTTSAAAALGRAP